MWVHRGRPDRRLSRSSTMKALWSRSDRILAAPPPSMLCRSSLSRRFRVLRPADDRGVPTGRQGLSSPGARSAGRSERSCQKAGSPYRMYRGQDLRYAVGRRRWSTDRAKRRPGMRRGAGERAAWACPVAKARRRPRKVSDRSVGVTGRRRTANLALLGCLACR